MKYESILIIGCGRLGCLVGDLLVKNGVSVIGTTREIKNFSKIERFGILPRQLDLLYPNSFFEDLPLIDAVIIALTPVHPKILTPFISTLSKLQAPAVVTSSTSVYPNTNGIVSEADAVAIRSPHSGLVMLEVEEAFSPLNPVILRFGGLFGEDMKPGKFLMGRTGVQGGLNPVNMTHLKDASRAILYSLKQELQNSVFNVVSPEHPSRQRFYEESAQRIGVRAPDFVANFTPHKIVSSNAFMNQGFTFEVVNPINAL